MTRGFAPTIGLLAVLAPAMAQAQTNLDQGKSASQIFAAACAECHKAPHGLANGKNSATVTEFLSEHYTTSRQQAAALAAYVLGGRGGEPIGAAAQGPGKKTSVEHGKASAEESKPTKRQAQKPAKPEEGTSANAKPQEPADADAKPNEEASPGETPSSLNPIMRPEGGQRPATATRNRRNKEPKTLEPAAVAHVPAGAITEPSRLDTPPREAAPAAMPSAAAPTGSASGGSGENAPVPRDDVPD